MREKRRGIIEMTKEYYVDCGRYFREAGLLEIGMEEVFDNDTYRVKYEHENFPVVHEGALIPQYEAHITKNVCENFDFIRVLIGEGRDIVFHFQEKKVVETNFSTDQVVWNK